MVYDEQQLCNIYEALNLMREQAEDILDELMTLIQAFDYKQDKAPLESDLSGL